jgi:Fe2+ transport system protein B
MIEVTKETRDILLEVAKKNKIYVEGNFLKILSAKKGDTEFQKYLDICKEKDTTSRRKRLQVTKQVQAQNKELAAAATENDRVNKQLSKALAETEQAMEDARAAEQEAINAKAEAETLRDAAMEDLELMQKKTQFELISTIVKVALYVIIGVGILTTVMYGLALFSGTDTQIIGSTWSNMFGILLTNAFSIVGTIMGVKYATEKD